MYLRWAIAMCALGLICQRVTPQPFVDLLTMRAVSARMAEVLR